jgi:hypothetical protein
MTPVFAAHPKLRLALLISVFLGMSSVLFLGIDKAHGRLVIPVFGGRTFDCEPCDDGGWLCTVGPPVPGKIKFQAGLTRVFLYYQLRPGVWWLGGGIPGGECVVGFVPLPATVTAQLLGTSLGISAGPSPDLGSPTLENPTFTTDPNVVIPPGLF